VIEAVLAFFSVGAAGIPMIGFLILMVLLDRYDREPIWLVSVVFLWGALGAIVIAVVGSLFFMIPISLVASDGAADLAGTVLIAPLVEEPAKALGVLLVAFSRHFDNATDGFVYGAAAGLGFGMTENGMYFIGAAFEGDVAVWVGTVFVRTLFTAMMHACATSIVGAAIGWTRYRGWGLKLVVVPMGLMLAMMMHAAWNGPLAIDTNGLGTALAFVIFPLEFAALFTLYQACLWGESRLIKRELALEADLGTLPAEHVAKLASWAARMRTDTWLPEGVDPGEYLPAATLLAFRRHQLVLSPGHERVAREVEELRGQIRILLA
jgi:RsiW-degrading membrane proteinase PrsW (M82 family)